MLRMKGVKRMRWSTRQSFPWLFLGLVVLHIVVAWLEVTYGQSRRPRIRGTNPRYRQGDWISYTVNRYVTSVAVGNEFVYFGTTGGITRYNLYTNRWDYPFTTSNGLADNFVTAVAYDTDTGMLWCATTQGISYYHPTAEKWSNLFKDEIGIPRFDDVVSIGIGENRIYFETRGGRMFEGLPTGSSIRLSTDSLPDHAPGIRWFGERATRHQRLPLFYMNDGYFFLPEGYIQDFRLRRAEISALASDDWGFMWLGSWGFGALKGELRTEELELLPFGLYSRHVNALALDRNGLWIGGLNRGLDRSGITYWDQVRGRWRYFESRFISQLLTDEINRLVVAGDSLFCATRFGLSIYDMAHDRWSKFTLFDGLVKDNVNDVLVEDGFAWVATDGGLNLIKLQPAPQDSDRVVEVAADDLHMRRIFDIERAGRYLWAATEFGVYRFDIERQIGAFVNEVNSPGGRMVTCIARYRNELWFGSTRSINVYNLDTRQWLGAPEKNIFLPGPVRAIAADSVSVWAGTDAGVLKYNRKTRDWRRFTVEDGLIDNQVNVILIDGDYVWFGTSEGLTLFYWNDPNRID